MKIKIKHTMALIQEEDSSNWNEEFSTPEQFFEKVKQHINEDPCYIIDIMGEEGELSSELLPNA